MAGVPWRIVHDTASTAAAGNTQNVTVGGGETRTPVCAIFHVVGLTADTTHTAHHRQGWGATDGTNQWVSAFASRDNVSTTSTWETHHTGAVMEIVGVTGVVGMSFSFNAFISGGVTLDIDTAAGGAFKFNVWFFFDGDFEVGTHTTSGTKDTQTTQTGMGFDPTFLYLHENDASAWNVTTPMTAQQISIGFAADNATSGTLQSCYIWYDEPNITRADVQMFTASNRGSGFIGGGSSLTTTVEYDFVSGGFAATTRDLSQAHYVGYVAGNIDGVDVWSGLIETPNTTGTHDYDEPNIECVAGIMMQAGGRTSPVETDVWLQGGAANPLFQSMWNVAGDEVSMGGLSEHNRTTSDTESYSDPAKIAAYHYLTGATETLGTLVGSLSTGGFQVNYTAVNTIAARNWPTLLFGPQQLYEAVNEAVDVTEEVVVVRRLGLEEAVNVTEEAIGLTRQAIDESVDVTEEAIGLTRQAIDEALGILEEVVAVTRQFIDEAVNVDEEVVLMRRLVIDEALDVTEDVQLVGVLEVAEALGITEEVGDLLFISLVIYTHMTGESGGPSIQEGESGGPRVMQGEADG